VKVPEKRFFVDPAAGSADNPGTEGAPWRTLVEVVTSGKIERRAADGTLVAAGEVRAGDALVLRAGDHGEVDLSGYFNPQTIHVLAAKGAHPKLAGLTIRTGSNWWIQGLTVQKSGCSAGEAIVAIGDTSAIELVGNTLLTTEEPAGWSASDWKTMACTGVHLEDVREVRAAFNEMRNVTDGIRINGTQITVERNYIHGFCGKAVPIYGSNTRGVQIIGNLATDAYNVGISQTLVHGTACAGCGDFVIRDNRLLAHRGQQVPAEFRKPVQGIGLFDGPFDKVEVVNNLVIGGHWHGITLLDGADVKIINNTTVMAHAAAGQPDHTWIMVTGSLASVVVRNNLTNLVDVGTGAIVDHNGVVSDPTTYFVDWRVGDFRPREGGPAVDGGSTDGAPADDLFGRPRDDRPDLGAFERQP
jgi:hypothetical protein